MDTRLNPINLSFSDTITGNDTGSEQKKIQTYPITLIDSLD